MNGKFIVITGLDGSGTTSIAKALAEQDPVGLYMQTPNGAYSQTREMFDGAFRIAHPEAHYLFYLSAVVAASDEIKEHLKTHNVYCVRYLIDTVVSHRVAGVDIQLNYDLGFTTIAVPDITIFIGLSEELRQQRISSRGKSELDKVLDTYNTRTAFLREFNQVCPDMLYVDNNTTVDACTTTVITKLHDLAILVTPQK
ncbi:TPA: AAA family ATPase [Aeromonas veronii]|nr:AAA family ATPase [Aeromonas veronii]